LGNKVCLFHSQDDPIVDFADFQKYRAALPEAVGKSFRNRGHFLQNRFPELVREAERQSRNWQSRKQK
jgi:predicted alpha/beta hydrolase family esterase